MNTEKLNTCFALLSLLIFLLGPCVTSAVASSTTVRGLIVSDLRTTLSAQIAGTIEKIGVDMGQRFTSGKLLVQLRDDVYQAQYGRAQAELKSARQRLEANHKLRELKSIGALDVLQSATFVEQKESELRLYEIQCQQCRISAPFDGRVVERLVSPYQFVTPGTPLLDIIDDKHLSVQAFVPSHWIRHIHKGQQCRLYVDEIDMTFNAEVTSLGARIDANSQMLEVRAKIEKISPKLLAGMSGQLDFGDLDAGAASHE